MKSKYFLIISLSLSWISLITIIIDLYTLIKLSISFEIYRENVNFKFHYTYNNTYYTNNYTDNNSYVDIYNNTNYERNIIAYTDNDMDHETKIISKNEYKNLGDFSFEITCSIILASICFFLLILNVVLYKDKKSNEKAKKLNKSSEQNILKSNISKILDNPKIDGIFDNEYDNDNDKDNDNGVSIINLRDEYLLN